LQEVVFFVVEGLFCSPDTACLHLVEVGSVMEILLCIAATWLLRGLSPFAGFACDAAVAHSDCVTFQDGGASASRDFYTFFSFFQQLLDRVYYFE